MTVANAILQGIFLGAFYAVLACGLSLMFGVMRIINLAHGDVAVLGAYLVLVIVQGTGLSPLLAFVIALPAMIALGYVLQLTVLQRALKAGILTPLLATFGLSIVIQNLLLLKFSPDVHSLGASAGALTTESWNLFGSISISALGLVVLEDDRHFFPPYDAALVWRPQIAEKCKGAPAALAALEGALNEAAMRKLNYAVDGQHRNLADLAREVVTRR